MDKTLALLHAATKHIQDRPEALRAPANDNSRVQAALSPTSQGKEIAQTDYLAHARNAAQPAKNAGVAENTPKQDAPQQVQAVATPQVPSQGHVRGR
jgi:hypothetical protein